MRWKLCSAALSCSARRLRAALVANPLVGAIAVVACLMLPFAALVTGRELSGVVRAAGEDSALAFAFALAIALAATSAGISVAALAPGRDFLGAQLEPAPVRPRDAFVGLVLLPAAVVGAPLTVFLFVFGVAAAGVLFGVHLVVGVAAGVASGAAAAEGAIGAARGSRSAALALIGVVAASALVGFSAGEVALGPLAPFASYISRGSLQSLALAGCAIVVALALWTFAATRRPSARPPGEVVRVRMPIARSAWLASASAMCARLARNRQVRRHVVTALAFALSGAAAVRLTLGDAAVAGFFAGSVALLAASVVPLVGTALRRDAGWLTRASPAHRRALAAADAIAAIVAGAGVIVVVLIAAAALGPVGGATYLLLGTTGLVVLGAAAATGAVLPWHPQRVIEQVASYALLAIVVVSLAFTLGRAADAATGAGIPDAAFALFASLLVLVGGVAVAAALEE